MQLTVLTQLSGCMLSRGPLKSSTLCLVKVGIALKTVSTVEEPGNGKRLLTLLFTTFQSQEFTSTSRNLAVNKQIFLSRLHIGVFKITALTQLSNSILSRSPLKSSPLCLVKSGIALKTVCGGAIPCSVADLTWFFANFLLCIS